MNSKKPVEHIEDKIKQAAENYQPPFDEKAWKAMEAKLDGDDKKRRPLLWWFVLPLLLAGGYGIYTLSNKQDVKKATVAESKVIPGKQQENVPVDGDKQSGSTTAAINASTTNTTAQADNENAVNKPNNTTGVPEPSVINNFNNNDQPGTSTADKKPVKSNDIATGAPLAKEGKINYKKNGKLHATSSGGQVDIAEESKTTIAEEGSATNNINKEVTKPVETVTKEKEAIATIQKPGLVKQDDKKENKEESGKKIVDNKKEQKPVEAKQEKQKGKNQGGFYAQLTGGTDAGSMHLFSFDNSSITGKFGLGLGYKFGKRFSVQTGFYITNKKYRAVGADYKIKAGSPMGMYPIEKIKAASLVYEVPLAIKYDIISKPSFILFGTAGVSSYIMQKEKYNCFYDYYGTTYENEWDYTGNKHFFSTAVFSFGIEKKLSGNLFLLAEPSFSIPLSGVGDGKMKIYSSSLQAGVKYYFGKK